MIYISLLQVKKKAMKSNTVVSSNKKQYLHCVIKWYRSLLLEKWHTRFPHCECWVKGRHCRRECKIRVSFGGAANVKPDHRKTFPRTLSTGDERLVWFLNLLRKMHIVRERNAENKNKSSRGVSSVSQVPVTLRASLSGTFLQTHTPSIAFRHLPPNSYSASIAFRHLPPNSHSEHRFPAPSSKLCQI